MSVTAPLLCEVYCWWDDFLLYDAMIDSRMIWKNPFAPWLCLCLCLNNRAILLSSDDCKSNCDLAIFQGISLFDAFVCFFCCIIFQKCVLRTAESTDAAVVIVELMIDVFNKS